jgi:hypothetical protein
VNKVLSAIKSLESASSLQMESDNGKVINSGSEKDASTALDPIHQGNGSTNDIEHCEPVHASTRIASRRKRTKLTTQNNYAPRRRNEMTRVGFDERYNQLLRFKK